MKLNKDERLLVEAFQSMLSGDAMLGLSTHKKDLERGGELERGLEYLHGQIDEMFQLKAAELTHHTPVCAAFSKVHNYKYIDDPTFVEAMDRELQAMAVPAHEREKARKFLPEIIEELSKDGVKSWSEKDFGFHPDLDDIMKMPGND